MPSSLTTENWTFLDTSGGESKDQNPNYHCVITCTDLNIQIRANLPQDFSISIGAQYEEALAQAVNSNGIVSEVSGYAKAAGVQLVTQALTAQVWQGSTEITFNLPLTFQVHNDENEDILKPIGDLYTLCLPDETSIGGLLTAPGPSLNVEGLVKSTGDKASGILNEAKGVVSSAASNLKSFVTGKKQLSNPTNKSSSAAGVNEKSPSNEGVKNLLSNAIKNNISLRIGEYMHFDSVVILNVDQTHHVQPLENGTMSRVDVSVTFKTFVVPTRKDIDKIFLGRSRAKTSLINPQARR